MASNARRWILLLCMACTCVGFPAAQPPGIFPASDYRNFAEEGLFASDVPPPSEVLGHPIGARPTWHAEIVRYFRVLDEASPRATLFTYGRTHEGRELVVLAVSSEENISRLEEIRSNLRRLADPSDLSREERRRLLAETPAVCWMAYTIHGDELSGSDAALALAYRLAAGEDDTAKMIRENLVVLIDPLQNPDGRDRFLSQVHAFNGKVPNPDTESLAHKTVWPWGRGNHYFFDLNRDWFPLVQPESRGRVKAVTSWMPQLVVDGHEMGAFSTYLFSPPRAPFNPFMTETLFKWWDTFARDQASAFDRYGWSYYTREWNEEWYPGYGSTWAIYSGAVGILYEQAGTEGTLVKRPDGTILSYGESVHHHYVSSMANLATAASRREELLSDYLQQREEAVTLGRKGLVREYLLPPGRDPSLTRKLVRSLLLQGIRVEQSSSEVTARDVHDMWGRRDGQRRFPAGTFRIPLDQPAARLIRVIMDFHLQMPDSFLQEERQYLERQKGSRLYEITAWSLAEAYGVPAYWSGKESRGSFTAVGELPEPDGKLENPDAEYGFLIPGDGDASLVAACRLMEDGFVVRAALEPFTIEGHDYPRGTFLLRREANPEELPQRLEALARELGIVIRGVRTARSTAGPDLGGSRFKLLQLPRIAMAAVEPTDFTSVGSLWYLLDYEMGLRVSLIDVANLGRTDLGKYNVLILPTVWGGPGTYRRMLGSQGLERLRRWVEAGGTLIGIGNAAAFLADTTTGLSRVRLRRQSLAESPPPVWGLDLETAEAVGLFQARGVETEPPSEEGEPARNGNAPGLGIPGPGEPVLGPGAAPFAGAREPWRPPAPLKLELSPKEWQRVDARLRRFRPHGTYLRVDLDPEHWLASGMPEKVAAMVNTSFAYLAEDPVRTIGRFAAPESLHVGGLLWPEAAGRWALTACFTREGLGRGQIVLIAVEPYLRAYHHATKRMLLNAAILGPGLGTTQTPPW
jgi:hypothetical protein